MPLWRIPKFKIPNYHSFYPNSLDYSRRDGKLEAQVFSDWSSAEAKDSDLSSHAQNRMRRAQKWTQEAYVEDASALIRSYSRSSILETGAEFAF